MVTPEGGIYTMINICKTHATDNLRVLSCNLRNASALTPPWPRVEASAGRASRIHSRESRPSLRSKLRRAERRGFGPESRPSEGSDSLGRSAQWGRDIWRLAPRPRTPFRARPVRPLTPSASSAASRHAVAPWDVSTAATRSCRRPQDGERYPRFAEKSARRAGSHPT